MLPEPVGATLMVVRALEALGVPYLIGGSMASAVYGVPRSTLDADIIAALRLEHVAPLVQGLGAGFYVDIDSVREAVVRRASFNVIHLTTMFKVDVFVSRERSFERSEFARRRRTAFATDPERIVYVAAPEDVILAKLEWYREGGEVSDRQWTDVLGVLKAQEASLDLGYLTRFAEQLQVRELLEVAFQEAGLA